MISILMVRSASLRVSNHEAASSFETRLRGRSSSDERNRAHAGMRQYRWTSSEKLQIPRAAAPRDGGVFDGQEQSAGNVYPALPRHGEAVADRHGVLDGCGDLDDCFRIGLPCRGGDAVGVRALVVRCGAYDRVE